MTNVTIFKNSSLYIHTIEYNSTETEIKIYPIIHPSSKDVATNLGSHGATWAPPNCGQEPIGFPAKKL